MNMQNHLCDSIPENYRVMLCRTPNDKMVWTVAQMGKVGAIHLVNSITHCPFCGEKLAEIPEDFR